MVKPVRRSCKVSPHEGNGEGSLPASPGGKRLTTILRRLQTLENVSVSEGSGSLQFPLDVYPRQLRNYIRKCAASIACPVDLLAVPMLGIAGAAIGRAGRRLKAKAGHIVSSCIWCACLDRSGGGKSPALGFVQNFFLDRQAELVRQWQAEKEEVTKNGQQAPPFPTLLLTDTTVESLQTDLAVGPVLFVRDELDGWCKQMGQYKSGNADRSDWCSIWSHNPMSIGRKSAGRVFVRYPFVAVTGMLVPESASFLNYGGHANDGFIHRVLLAYPESMLPKVTTDGVRQTTVNGYREAMARLFDGPAQVLKFDERARVELQRWGNHEHYAELDSDTPHYLIAKYRKHWEYANRPALVFHEIKRIVDGTDEPSVTLDTVQRVICVIEYFKRHILVVQAAIGAKADEVDDYARCYNRLRGEGTITVRQAVHRAAPFRNASRGQVLGMFKAWEERGFGKVKSTRKNQNTFVFTPS